MECIMTAMASMAFPSKAISRISISRRLSMCNGRALPRKSTHFIIIVASSTDFGHHTATSTCFLNSVSFRTTNPYHDQASQDRMHIDIDISHPANLISCLIDTDRSSSTKTMMRHKKGTGFIFLRYVPRSKVAMRGGRRMKNDAKESRPIQAASYRGMT